jgi:predicted RNA-binding protein YlxR (DUF448 family)
MRMERARVAQKPRREPVRTCVACRVEASKGALVRFVRRADGGVAVDRTGHAAGRGAYLHAALACIEIARKRKTLERALKTTLTPDIWDDLIKTT